MALPPKPPNICTLAWEGVFAARFGYWDDPVTPTDKEGWKSQCWTGGYTYSVSSVVWLECAHAGCIWCRSLENHFMEDIKSRYPDRPIPDETIDIRVGRDDLISEPAGSIPIRTCCIIFKYGERAYRSVFLLKAYADDPAAPYVSAADEGHLLPVPHVGERHVLEWTAKVWMEDCAQNHKVCRRLGTPDSGDWLPTRLIDCSGPGNVRIIETSEKMDRVRYVALSYVWGKGPPESQAHRTTTDNLSARIRVGIATETLPRTIRDAIYVTRTLGFYFLWIDSLCIIQDSAEDKHREVRSMARVYRHAYLTIDAATAASVEDGFLQDRPLPNDRDDIVFPFVCPASPGDGHVQAEARMGNVYFPGMGLSRMGYVYFPRDIDTFSRGRQLFSYADWEEPSSNEGREFKNETRLRGWCLQETLLSTRSLIFDKQSLSVKCQTRPTLRHVGIDQDWGQVSGLYDVIPIPIPGSATAVRPGSGGWNKIHERWLEIAMDYSKRSLSYRSDKLLACAAIAEVFAPHLGGYLAGSWSQTILYDLLWRVDCGPSEYLRLREYEHAPSWSWASANAEIKFAYESSPSATLRLVAEVVDHSIALQHETLHFGPVLPGGSLVLRAPLLSCKHHRNVYRFEYQQSAFEFPHDSFRIYHDHSDGPDLQNVFLVPIIDNIEVNADSEENSHHQACGILIAQAEWSISQSARFQDHSEVYQRIGYWFGISSFFLRGDEDPDELYHRFTRMLQVVPKVEIVLV